MNNTNQISYSNNSFSPALDSESLTLSIDLIDGQAQKYPVPPHLEYKAFLTTQLNDANNYALDHKNIKPTTTDLAHYRKKQQIEEFLKQSTKKVIFPNTDYLASEKSVKNSLLILRKLDDSYDLPKIATDEDGVIIFVWENIEKTCLLTFEEDSLHLYSHDNNGTTLERVDDINFSEAKFFSDISPMIF